MRPGRKRKGLTAVQSTENPCVNHEWMVEAWVVFHRLHDRMTALAAIMRRVEAGEPPPFQWPPAEGTAP